MGRTPVTAALALALVAGACGGSSVLTTSTTSTTVAVTLPPSTTSTTAGPFIELEPNGPPFLRQGDRNEYVAALQFYLVCTGHERITEDGPAVTVDGVFGPITAQMVAYVQARMRKVPTGAPDEAMFISLARMCGATRTIEFGEDRTETRVAGNVTPTDDDVWILTGESGRTLTVEVAEGQVQFTVHNEAGNLLKAARDGNSWSAELADDGDYRIRVLASATSSYSLRVELPPPPRVTVDFGPLSLDADGLGVAVFGDEPTTALEAIEALLGEATTDSGWEGGAIPGCEGFNRHYTWVIDPAEEGDQHPTVLAVHMSDVGFPDGSFAQYEYYTLDIDGLDVGARALTTAEGMSLGASLTEYTELYGSPRFLDPAGGLVEFGEGMVAGIDQPGEDAPADFTQRVWYISAGADGCQDFD